MKKYIVVNFFILITLVIIPIKVKATEMNVIDNDELSIEKQKEQYGISRFINNSQKYTDEIDLGQIFNEGLSGNFNNNRLIKLLFKLMGDELKQSLLTVSGIIIIIIINSILRAISENLGNESVSKIAYYIQYILIVTLIMKNFSEVIGRVKIAIEDLTGFASILIPSMTTLIIATGNITTSGLLEPILITMVTFISNFFTNILIPTILVATALGIISKISDSISIEKLSKFLNKYSIWVLTTVLGIFIGISALESGLTNNLDIVTKKAGKSVISTAVPVVGGIIGSAIDIVIGYTNIIKNATGIVGIFVILAICLKPIINLAILTLVYNLGSAICEPIADKKVVELIELMSNTFKTMLAIMFTITTMVVIGIALVIKITS